MTRETSIELDILPLIDHSLLNPLATQEYVERWCAEADRFGFGSVCVFPTWVRLATELLHQKKPIVSTVIGFPTGAATAAVKLYEAMDAVEQGAKELDVVLNLAQLCQGDANRVHRELAEICEETNIPVRAIAEINLLTPETLALAVNVCIDAGATAIMTCTGWNGGVSIEAVRYLKTLTKGQIGIKASAGIKDYQFAIDLVVAGASRLGTSYAIEMIRQWDEPAPASNEAI